MPEVLREGGRPKKLPTLVREAIRRRHMSGRTEESYVIPNPVDLFRVRCGQGSRASSTPDLPTPEKRT